MLAHDRFLVEANWAKVDELVNFRSVAHVGGVAQETFLERLSECPECNTLVFADRMLFNCLAQKITVPVYIEKLCSNGFEGTSHFHRLLPISVIANVQI